MKRHYVILLITAFGAPIMAWAENSCPAGYISVDMPDVEIADTCGTGYTSAGEIANCDSGNGVCAVIDTVQCDAGYYLDNGECKACANGKPFYCPGDNKRYSCPENTARKGSGLVCYNREANNGIAPCSDISHCVLIDIPLPGATHGPLLYRCFYNESIDVYSLGCHFGTGARSYQHCDAGYYWPTGGSAACFDSDGNCVGCAACDCVAAGKGYYSPADSPDRTNCPTGYTTGGTTASDASECNVCATGYGRHGDACEPLCSAGATMFHADDLTFNLYPTTACASPAIRIGLDGGECCVHLVPGETTDAVHINYNGTVYHTTN